MMKKYKYYLLLVVALIVYLIFVKPDNRLAIQQQSSQAVKKTVVDKPNQKKSSVINKTPKDSPVEKTQQKKHKEEQPEQTDISYLQAYRDYHFFKSCYWVINVTQKGEDLDIVFKQKIKASAEKLHRKETNPNQQQKAVFEVFKNKCLDLMLVQDKDFNKNKELLKQKYQNIEPLSKEEKHLFAGLGLYQEYNTLTRRVYQQKQGALDLENPLVVTLKQKISYIKSELNRIQWGEDVFYENETKQLQARDLESAISIIRKELSAYKLYDSALITQLEDEEAKLLKQMVFLLKRSESPEVLLLFAKVLWSPYTEKKLNIDVFSKIKVYDLGLALSIYDAGMTLAACALNYPCGKGSSLSFGYCFNNFVIYNEACGKPVEDYLFNYVISPNQLQDVDNFITTILENYAKN